ncbi:MAG TPA: hypothetical protein VH374_10395 [Polyangia bacterium]|jgi:hypothetical protein|nr:hypothetical protein [Polyangia bacterium]
MSHSILRRLIRCSFGGMLLLAGCHGDGPELAVDAANGGGATRGNGGNAGTNGSDAGGTAGSGDGGGKIPVGSTQCSDGIDNDGDGLIDYDDPECVGPLDNDEGSFATGIPGDNVDPCRQDCFFDGNSGMGDDGCDWQLKCDPLNVGATASHQCAYDAKYVQTHAMECSVSASQSAACIKNCRPLTPNGCDCFGCCLIPGAATAIRLAGTCTAKDFGDPSKCPPCTQVQQCSNPCDHCELCVGKTTLPADCANNPGDGGAPTPDAGTTPTPSCGSYAVCARTAQGSIDPVTACPQNYGCVQGCCIPTVIIP